MIDIHCHILPAIDDGCQDLKSALKLLEKAERAGISDVILTPHYIRRSKYHCNNVFKNQLLEILKEGCNREGIKVDLHVGNEVYIDFDMAELIKKQEISTLAGSRYLLIELPVRAEDLSAKTTCFELISQGFVPVIAHPERYEYMQNDISKLEEFLQIGCLAQGDYRSLIGRYGKRAQKTLKQMLFNNQISFLASDIHSADEEYSLDESRKKLMGILKDTHLVEQILVENPRKIIEDKEIVR